MDSSIDCVNDIIKSTIDLMLDQLKIGHITLEAFNEIFSNLIEAFDENDQKSLLDYIDYVEDRTKECLNHGKSKQDIEFEKYLDELDEP